MRTFLFYSIVLLSFISIKAQNVVTQSVDIKDFVPFVVENIDSDLNITKNLTLILQTKNSKFSNENFFILKQGIQLLKSRLNTSSKISIVIYDEFDGILLENAIINSEKQILNLLSNYSKNIRSSDIDGISLGYNIAENYYDDKNHNEVIIIRNNEEKVILVNSELNSKKEKKFSGTGQAILVSTLAILPELINVIKD
jgi:hypothetical protein